MKETKKSTNILNVLKIIIIFGFLISIVNLLHNRSLWLDEAMLALNIVDKSFGELLQPLEMNQVAPIGFLYVEKLMTIFFGNKDFVLRIFPFVLFLLSVPLFFIFCKKIFQSNLVGLLACSFFILNRSLLAYSTMVKQYSGDVFIMLFIMVVALRYNSKRNSQTLIFYTFVGIGAVWFSNVSVIILFTVGLFSLYGDWMKSKNIIPLLLVISGWMTSFFVYYFFFVYSHPTKSTMVDFWGNSFLPQNIFKLDFYSFLFQKTIRLLKMSMPFAEFWIAPLVLFLAGVITFFKEKKIKFLYLLIFPIILHFIISSFKLYPFSSRLTLYMIPLVVLVCVIGLLSIYHLFNNRGFKIPLAAILLPFLFSFFILSKNIPIEIEEIKKSMSYVNEHLEKEDKIYIYYGAIPAFQFYQQYFFEIGASESIQFGTSHYQNWEEYDREILGLTKTNWLIFSHVYPYVPAKENEEQYMIKTLKSNGYEILNQQKYKGSSVYRVSRIPNSF